MSEPTETTANATTPETEVPAIVLPIVPDGVFQTRPGTDASTPERPVAMDLDSLEREGAPARPFDFQLAKRRYLMADPKEVDWQDLIAAISNPIMFFRLVLPADDRTAFFTTKLPSWKMEKLINAYLEHYGLPNLPNAGGLPR